MKDNKLKEQLENYLNIKIHELETTLKDNVLSIKFIPVSCVQNVNLSFQISPSSGCTFV